MCVDIMLSLLTLHFLMSLAHLHFSAEELLLYPRCVSVRVRVSVHMQNVRAKVKVLEFKNLFYSCILTSFIILIRPLTTKTYDRCASGDCGTSGFNTIYAFDNPLQIITPWWVEVGQATDLQGGGGGGWG